MQRLQQYSHNIPMRSIERGKHDRNLVAEHPVRLYHCFLETIKPAVLLDFNLFFIIYSPILSMLPNFSFSFFVYFLECIVHSSSFVGNMSYKCNETASFYLDTHHSSYSLYIEIHCYKYDMFE
jgi:hypothetical protein